MVLYVIKRILLIIPIMIGVTFFLFMLLMLMPGDAALIVLGTQATEEQIQMFRDQNGLNDPAIVQYVNYMIKVVQGDLGMSFNTRQSVNSMIAIRAPTTLFLSLTSMVLTIAIALPLGVTMAVKQNSLYDNSMRVVTIILTSMPVFWLAIMMILLFTVKLNWLPSVYEFRLSAVIMPLVCLACQGVTMCARTGRSSMLEVINQDYIRTARAKGLRYGYIIRRHALKNAMMPMVSVYGRIIATCFSGSVVLETVFGINGIGTMMLNALRQKDVPAIMGSIVISCLVITGVNILTDITYAFIDPRIKSKYIKRKTMQKEVSVSADK